MSADEAKVFIVEMEESADTAPEIPLTAANWDKLFGESGIVTTPIGEVKMGEHQFLKLMRQGRDGKLGMIKPTLQYPDAVVEDESSAKPGTKEERGTSYVFIKAFKKADGSRYYYFTSITVSKDGKEVVVSNQEKSRNRILRLLTEGSVVWRAPKDAATASVEQQGLDYAQPLETEAAAKGSGVTPQSTSISSNDESTSSEGDSSQTSVGKGNTLSTDKQGRSGESSVKSDGNAAEKTGLERAKTGQLTLGEAVSSAEAETDTNPTEAQKKAGNYKKGHVQIGTFDVTIENPKGSIRRGTDTNGKEWQTKMQNTYGYIRGTESVDGDHIDVFLAENIDEWNGHRVFVIDQYNPDGTFDEHKVMLGFNDRDDAASAYASNYEDGWMRNRRIVVSSVTTEDFEKWIDSSHRKTKPFAEYAIAQNRESSEVVAATALEADKAETTREANLFGYFSGTIQELIDKAKESATGLIKKIIAPVSERLRKDLSAKGIEVDEDYKHVIDNNAIRHTLKNHGGSREEKRGQIPVTNEDFDRIEDVVANYDTIEVETGKRGNDNIIYSKTYKDGTTIFVEEKRDGRKELAAITMWKKKNPTRTDANRSNATQISDLDGISAGEVSEKTEKCKLHPDIQSSPSRISTNRERLSTPTL